MLPVSIEKEVVQNDFEIVKETPSKTYRMDLYRNRIAGMTDGKEAMVQAIFKVLNTERFQYGKIYSNNYGVEFLDLYGKHPAEAEILIQRRIFEALTWDDRITSVENFVFSKPKKDAIAVTFTAVTIFGDVKIEGVEVKI